jgi:uncharacterized protein YjbI with pentapeptide repeats
MIQDLYETKKVPLSQQDLNRILRAHELYVAHQGGMRAQLAHKILDGLVLANRNLEEADFSGASLVGASLYGSKLHRAILYCADLRECDLRAAKLTRADMRGASFKGAQLSYAVLDNADLRSGMMMHMGAEDVSFSRQGEAGPQGVDFSNCSMKGASFGGAKLDGANFTGALPQGAMFRGATLTNALFKDAVLTGILAGDLKVPPESLEGAVRDTTPEAAAKAGALKARLEAHQQWIATQGREGAPANLEGEDLRPLQNHLLGRRLSGLAARHAVAIGLDFSESQLQAAKFEGADLRGANFSKADLRGASFKDAKLAHANFTGADLRALPLANGTMLAADLGGVTEEQLRGAIRA